MYKSSPSLSSKSSPRNCDTPSSRIPSDKPTIMVEGTKICNTFAQLSLVLEQLLTTHKCGSDEQEDGSFLSIMLKSVTNIKCLSIDSHLLSLIGLCTTSFQDPEMGCYIESSLLQSTQGGDDELNRVCAKVKRAVEKVRRLGVKALELIALSSSVSSSTLADALSTLLLACVARLQSTISEQACRSLKYQVILCFHVLSFLDTDTGSCMRSLNALTRHALRSCSCEAEYSRPNNIHPLLRIPFTSKLDPLLHFHLARNCRLSI